MREQAARQAQLNVTAPIALLQRLPPEPVRLIRYGLEGYWPTWVFGKQARPGVNENRRQQDFGGGRLWQLGK